ncbi:hypothetical protein [Pseudarthrobacter sp. NS4]|uniref:hypothetical protein n=1 Tax=Pseudarthrobacter sp. NS4 TaxID=2973976 RepID=UPI002161B8AF|nr:hypothetical protein [Pseudarthrobacter sp. NS4]
MGRNIPANGFPSLITQQGAAAAGNEFVWFGCTFRVQLVTHEDIEPPVDETETPGAPIVTTDVRSSGETCYNNASTPEQRRNRC